MRKNEAALDLVPATATTTLVAIAAACLLVLSGISAPH